MTLDTGERVVSTVKQEARAYLVIESPAAPVGRVVTRAAAVPERTTVRIVRMTIRAVRWGVVEPCIRVAFIFLWPVMGHRMRGKLWTS